jgi:hypothetical protein
MWKELRFVGSGLRFARRRPRELWLLARAAGCVITVSVLVKFLPLPRVLTIISPRRGRRGPAAAHLSEEKLAQLIDSLLAFDVLCFTPTCWKRAPVLHRYLALGGRETRIVFGLRKGADAALAGHAWLEADGRPIFEAAPPDYTVTYTFPTPDSHATSLKRVR